MTTTTSTNSFVYTTAIKKIRKLKRFVKGIQGGTSAGKTFGILPILIHIGARNPLIEISVVAESIPHLKRGAIKDFKKIMVQTGRWNPNNWNASDYKYTFYNGSVIEFFSADNDAKLRGARRDYLYMNECNNMTFHAYTELASRTKKGIYLDWNPTKEFWFHTELQNDDDVDMLIINYLDNEACPESALNFILKAKEKSKTSAYWENWYRVYGLGLVGKLDGQIYDWEVIQEVPNEAELISYGLDFGYNDPTVLVSLYKWSDGYVVHELMYRPKLDASQYQSVFASLNLNKNITIKADGSRPELIKAISNIGLRITGADKRDKVDRIMLLSAEKIYVTASSLNIIKEQSNYVWKPNNTALKDVPIEYDDHSMDAVLYSADGVILRPKQESKYFIY
jgi:phage terminase large subunit